MFGKFALTYCVFALASLSLVVTSEAVEIDQGTVPEGRALRVTHQRVAEPGEGRRNRIECSESERPILVRQLSSVLANLDRQIRERDDDTDAAEKVTDVAECFENSALRRLTDRR